MENILIYNMVGPPVVDDIKSKYLAVLFCKTVLSILGINVIYLPIIASSYTISGVRNINMKYVAKGNPCRATLKRNNVLADRIERYVLQTTQIKEKNILCVRPWDSWTI